MPLLTIQDLPIEVLLEIFHAFLGPQIGRRGGVDDLKRRQRPVLLTHICRDWRMKALSEPSLWKDVQIHGVSELFLSFLERSHPLPVDVTVRATAHRLASRTAEALRNKFNSLAESHIKRIQSIWMLNLARREIALALVPLDRPDLPSLKSLHIRGGMWDGTQAMHAHHTAFLTRPTSIDSVTLGNLCTSCIPCPQALTKLEILNFPAFLDASTLQSILNASPVLEILVLGYSQNTVEVDDTVPVEPAIINAPRLKRLAVTSQAVFSCTPWKAEVDLPCSPVCYCTFRNLIAENLECLEITGKGCDLALVHLVHSWIEG
ncbi:hypothetical protein NMY22_g8712 [Coprinellus aureogranulatus]|nr:hypothetical protein NMY22_g8712 [Coprinellus aureogranulatus]